jgi:gluconolactonase
MSGSSGMTRWPGTLVCFTLLLIMGPPLAAAQSLLPDRSAHPFSITRADPALDALVAPDAELRTIADGFGFIDTPVWVRGKQGAEGYLLASSIIDNVIYKVTPSGRVSVFLDKAGYSGDDFASDGKLALIGRARVILMGPGCVAIDGHRAVTR